MIPSVIVAAAIAAVWLRWWAVPAAALLWTLVIAPTVEARDLFGVSLLGAANGAVGVAFALAVLAATRHRPRPRQSPR